MISVFTSAQTNHIKRENKPEIKKCSRVRPLEILNVSGFIQSVNATGKQFIELYNIIIHTVEAMFRYTEAKYIQSLNRIR